MKTNKLTTAAALTLGALSSFAALPAFAEDGANVEIGSLVCHQASNTNLIVVSNASYDCTFSGLNGDTEQFSAKISKVGVDLSSSREAVLSWYVFAPASTRDGSALSGTYVGASADASFGAGVGTRVLTGGFDRSFTLQPASVSGEVGIGAAAGVERMRLNYRG